MLKYGGGGGVGSWVFRMGGGRQPKDLFELFEKRRKLLPGYRYLSHRDMTWHKKPFLLNEITL